MSITDLDMLALRSSNSEPLEPEVVEIQRRMRDIDQVLDVLQQEALLPISNDSGSWELAKNMLVRRKEAYSSILSPIRRVPPEIWAEIFQHRRVDVHTFAQVCRPWRNTVMSTPRLWTTVIIDLCYDLQDEHSTQIATKLIERSGSLGMSMCLFYDHTYPEINIRHGLEALPGKERWKRLYTGPHCIHPLFSGTIINSWSMLEELIVDGGLAGDDPIFHAGRISFMHLRALKRLTLKVQDLITTENLVVPWSQLTYLHLDSLSMSVVDYLSVLCRCDNLEECLLSLEVTSYASIFTTSFWRKCIPLHKLRSLSLKGLDDPSPILTCLQLPALKYLNLTSRSCEGFIPSLNPVIPPGVAIAKLIKESRCSIRRLELHSIDMNIADSFMCFRSLASLEELKVTNIGRHTPLNIRLVNELNARTLDPRNILLPRLTSLEAYTPSNLPSFYALQKFIYFRTSLAHARAARLERANLTHQDSRFCPHTPFSLDALSPFVSTLREYGIDFD